MGSLPEIKEMMAPGGKWYTLDLYLNKKPGTYFTYGNIYFGIIGTLIEALSRIRYDIYMRDHVLLPIGIKGSYNVLDIPDINTVAVLYRNSQPQSDNYGGIKPAQPDLS